MSVGDVISEGQDIIEMETDKATVPVPASIGGKVTKVNVSEGDSVPIGGVLLEVEAEEAAETEQPPAEPQPSAEAEPEAAEPEPEPEAEAEPAAQPRAETDQSQQAAEKSPEAAEAPRAAEQPAPTPQPRTSSPGRPSPGRPSPDGADSAAQTSADRQRRGNRFGRRRHHSRRAGRAAIRP